jgi:hypothetical protein
VPTLVWLDIDATSVADRIARRGAARDAAKVAGRNGASSIDLAAPGVPHVRADAAQQPQVLVDAVLEGLMGGAARQDLPSVS